MSTTAKVLDIVAAVKGMIARFDGTFTHTSIPDGHLYDAYKKAITDKSDAAYPKVVVALDGGKLKQLPSRQKNKLVGFDIIFIFKKTQACPDEPEVAAQHLIDDMEKVVDNDTSLGGLLEDLHFYEWTSDSGFANPEGVVWVKLAAEYQTIS